MGTRPNILYIMSDDHASNAISAYGSRLAKDAPTPNIDRIGSEGMVLTNCHCTNSICTPSRASVLTGQHSHVNGVRTLYDRLPDGGEILSEILSRNGYRTALFGKWHLLCEPRGFDDWAVLPGQGVYHDPAFLFPSGEKAPEGTVIDELDDTKVYTPQDKEQYAFGVNTVQKGYVTDIVTDLALDWLKSYVGDQRGDQPFFLCCQHKAPHDFFEYKQCFEDLYRDVDFEEPPTLFEDEAVQQEISRRYGSTVSERWEPRNMVGMLERDWYPNGGPMDFSGLEADERTRKAYQKYMQDYLRTVHSIDENVGRILDYLDSSGLAENTIVVYTSDQGMMLGEHDHIDKRWIFDESQRMPFLVRFPKEIPAGSVSDDIVDNVDFAQTFLDFAGFDAPEGMQGRSFRPILSGSTPEDWRQSTYYRYWMHMSHHWVPAHYGIRTKDFKLVFFYGMKLDATVGKQEVCDVPTDPGFELYDLKKDPLETTNVYGDPAYAETVKELKRQLLDLKELYGDTDEKYPELEALRLRLWD